jgi:hypothetical protein
LAEDRVAQRDGKRELAKRQMRDKPFHATAVEFNSATPNSRATARANTNTAQA